MKIRNIKIESSGFTLIETLIYIAFFAVLVGSLLGITFQTIDNSARLSKKITIQQEANFILRKIEWALNNAETVSDSSGPETLTVNMYAPAVPVSFSYLGNNMTITRGGVTEILNSENVNVSAVDFVKTNKEIKVSLNVEGENFELTKFLRK